MVVGGKRQQSSDILGPILDDAQVKQELIALNISTALSKGRNLIKEQ